MASHAGTILIVGLLRAIGFEQGTSYYFQSVPFMAKVSLFLIFGLLSIYPTVEFLSWRDALQQGQAPIITTRNLRMMPSSIRWKLLDVGLIVPCTMLPAQGVGFLG